MGNFLISYLKTNKTEGGYAKTIGDSGGETYSGIARNFFPNWKGFKFIDVWKEKNGEPKNNKIFSEEETPGIELLISNFYRENFWNKLRGDEITQQDWCDNLYDTAVNQGVVSAIHFAQDTLNLERTSIMNDETLNAINNN